MCAERSRCDVAGSRLPLCMMGFPLMWYDCWSCNLRSQSGRGLWHNQSEQTMNQQVTLTRQAVRTPRAAAVAGIIFSVLFTTSMVLIRLALPEELRGTDIADWLQGNTTTIS